MAKKKVEKVDMNKRTAQFRETNPSEFNASEYEYIYKVNRTSGEISLYKGGKEIPNDIQTQFGGLGQPDNVIKPPWDTYELEWLLKLMGGKHMIGSGWGRLHKISHLRN